MTRWEQPADDPYSALDHMDGLGENLAELPVEDRRAFVEADTQIEYRERKSRRESLAIAACLTGFLAVVVAVIALMEVLP